MTVSIFSPQMRDERERLYYEETMSIRAFIPTSTQMWAGIWIANRVYEQPKTCGARGSPPRGWPGSAVRECEHAPSMLNVPSLRVALRERKIMTRS